MKRRAWVCFEAAWRQCVRVVAALGLCSACLASAAAEDAGATLTLERAEILLGDASASPPADTAAWQPVSLPDDWERSRFEASGYAWYRLSFELPRGPQRLHAIQADRLRAVAAVYVNGRLVGQTDEFGQRPSPARAQIFQLPQDVLVPGRNVVHVRLWVKPGWRGMVTPLQLGDWQVLQRVMARQQFNAEAVPALAAALAAYVAGFGLLIWWQRRDEAMLGYFALSALALAMQVPVELSWWGLLEAHPDERWMLTCTLKAAKYTFMLFYTMRFAQVHRPRLEKWVVLTMVLVLATWFGLEALQVRGTVFMAQQGLWLASWLLPGVAALLFMFVALRRTPLVECVPLLLAHVVSVAGSLYSGFAQNLGRIEVGWLHMMPLLIVMGCILARRFSRALGVAEALNKELADRVEAKRVELEANYRRLADLESQQAVVAERARLMSDMHDGIGGQLISTLSLVEAGDASKDQVADALRECIDDLRLAIDSLQPADDDLLPVLGNLRYRLEPRLRASGIALDWQVDDVPRLACLTPQNVLHVLRILQEAFTNVLKHAQANCIRVSTASGAGGVTINVSDNGRGLAESTAKGHGLANMRQRAQALGGELLVRSSAAGTTLSLQLPVG